MLSTSRLELQPADGTHRPVDIESPTQSASVNLRVGDWVEVRSAKEILATLDGGQALEGLPFMPEMLQYCGKRYQIGKSAHKTCDTIESYSIRRMERTVHLEDLRCDGEAHGGCQAGCRLFWKEAWLKPVPNDAGVETSEKRQSTLSTADIECLHRASRLQAPEGEKRERYRCQATDLLKATTQVRRRDRLNPFFYLKDLTSGNVSLYVLIRYGAMAALNAFMLRWFGWRFPRLQGRASSKTPEQLLNLQPGDLVQVRSKTEIMQTLNSSLRNRGLSFDPELVQYCEGGTFRVLRRVDRIVNEKTGYMTVLPNPCMILDGVTCTGTVSAQRMFCPRAVYPYWHEVWLKRAKQ
jgi:hypothetical protein